MAADPERIAAVIDRLVSSVVQRDGWVDPAARRHKAKTDGSRVTDLDQAIETEWRSIIGNEFPGHTIVGEEFGSNDRESDYVWILDPIDGTDDFTRGIPLFGYLIALTHNGVPIAAAAGHPLLGVDVRAGRGEGTTIGGNTIRPFESDAPSDPAIAIPAADDFLRQEDRTELLRDIGKRFRNYRVYRNLFGHTSVVRGALQAGLEFDVAEWDFLATRLMIEESGGLFRYFRVVQQDNLRKYGVVFGHPDTVSRLCNILREHGYECASADDFDALGV